VQQGKALYVGISSYGPERTKQAAAILADLGTPLLIHQPSYSMLNRHVETSGLLEVLGDLNVGCIAFTALAQGLLTNKYLGGVPEGSRASRPGSLSANSITDDLRERLRGLHDIADGRGQSLAQLAVAWVLRDPRMTSLVIGASSVAQLEDTVAATENLEFSDEELALIDRDAVDDPGVDLWRSQSEVGPDPLAPHASPVVGKTD
jgi:L-glyceraldehyde 3-phosphate reductase